MSLIKRSVVLYKDNTKGMLTVIRLGETIGAKLALNEKPNEELWLGIKLGDCKQQNFRITEQLTEFKPDCDLCLNDSIGAIILNIEGNIFAYGGTREKVSISLIKEFQIKSNTPEIKAEVIQAEVVQAEVVQAEVVQAEVVQAEVVQAEVVQAEVVQAEVVQAGVIQIETIQVEAPNENIGIEKEMIASMEIKEDTKKEPESKDATKTKTKVTTKSKPDLKPEPKNEEVRVEVEPEFSAENEIDNTFWQVQDSAENKKRNPFDIPKAKNFYQAIRGRLEEIMTINPKESELEKLIPDSEWVKVRYNGEDYYVVGRMYENDLVSYLGYGVPGVEDVRPPKEAEELCDFLPLPSNNGVGYWLMFQKAEDGSISKEIQ